MKKKTAETNRKWDKKRIARVLLFIAVCAAIGLTTGGMRSGLLFLFDWNSEDGGGGKAGVSEKERLKVMQESVDDSRFSFRINGNISFADGGSEGVLFIENPEDNDCLLRVTITLDGNGQVIYETGYLKPGTGVGKDRLDVFLPAGEYEATAAFAACDSHGEETGRAEAAIHISIRR